jgi:hypothetical protein
VVGDERYDSELGGTQRGPASEAYCGLSAVEMFRSEDVEQASAKPTFDGIDQIPLFEGERIVAVWERGCKSKRKLDDSLLVSTDAPLWEFIHTVHEQPYRLVVQKTKIDGIVTWSDLLKVPVFVRVCPVQGGSSLVENIAFPREGRALPIKVELLKNEFGSGCRCHLGQF